MAISNEFDYLPHSLIAGKLHKYCLSFDSWALLSSYSGSESAQIKDTRSPWKDVTKVVPGDSILYALYLFINDMFFFIDDWTLDNYANDNSVYSSSANVHRVLSLLQNDCKKAVQLFTSNGMQANPKNSVYVIIVFL